MSCLIILMSRMKLGKEVAEDACGCCGTKRNLQKFRLINYRYDDWVRQHDLAGLEMEDVRSSEGVICL